MRLACSSIAQSPHIVDPEFTKLGAHESPETLRKQIQDKIDEAGKKEGYDAVLLGYGLCGNAALGLRAGSIPLVIPRAHDCCTIFLGGKSRFIELFKDNLSAEWSSAGYMERSESYLRETDTGRMLGLDKSYDELVEQYGEENARYIWETIHPEPHGKELIFIEIPETSHLGYLHRMEELAGEEGKQVRVLDGDMRLIRNLVCGDWNTEDFLVVPPGCKIRAVYDHEKIITAGD